MTDIIAILSLFGAFMLLYGSSDLIYELRACYALTERSYMAITTKTLLFLCFMAGATSFIFTAFAIGALNVSI